MGLFNTKKQKDVEMDDLPLPDFGDVHPMSGDLPKPVALDQAALSKSKKAVDDISSSPIPSLLSEESIEESITIPEEVLADAETEGYSLIQTTQKEYVVDFTLPDSVFKTEFDRINAKRLEMKNRKDILTDYESLVELIEKKHSQLSEFKVQLNTKKDELNQHATTLKKKETILDSIHKQLDHIAKKNTSIDISNGAVTKLDKALVKLRKYADTVKNKEKEIHAKEHALRKEYEKLLNRLS